jgi:hypothetical protein
MSTIESRERPERAPGLPSRKKFAAMTTGDQWRVVDDWLRRTRKTLGSILREARRLRSLAGPHTLSGLECRRRRPWDVVSPLLALEREWDRCHQPPKPRRRVKHPTLEEIARMAPRERHFALWDYKRRKRIQMKYMETMMANTRREIGEEQFQEWLNDPDPKFDFVRNMAESKRRAKELRDRPLDN